MKDGLTEILTETFDEQYKKRMLITPQHTADYLLENGVFVPQLQAGNTVWVIDNFRTFTKPIIESRTVLSVQYYKSGAIQYHYKDGSFYKEHIGRTVFFTREEAEQALKERQGE